nr:unnamed protein product [Spirometra erinaceieuropaei]
MSSGENPKRQADTALVPAIAFTSYMMLTVMFNELDGRLAELPVACTDKNAPVENRWCQLRDTVQSTAVAALGRARRQNQAWSDDNGAAISNLLAEENWLHKA